MTARVVFVPVFCLAAFLGGCSVSAEYQRPDLEVPAAFSSARASSSAVALARDWWASFGSDELNRLVDRALAGNTDLRAAARRIEQARAQLRVAGADLLPEAGAGLEANRQRENPAGAPQRNETRLGAGLQVGYEIDLFGGNRAAVAGAEARLRAAALDGEAVHLLTMGEVARSFFTVVNGYERLRVSDDTLKNARELLKTVEARFEVGAASQLEMAQQRAALATTEASRANIQRGIATAENALAVLLGLPAQSVRVETRSLSGLSIPDIAPGQPSALLERRPDIRRAEEDLIAAEADIAVARAAFFPRLTIGLDAQALRAGFGDPTATTLSLLSGLTAPLFQGGRLEGQRDAAVARQLELVEAYRKAVLVSFQDVEDALAAVRATQRRETALAIAERESSKAYRIALDLYEAGSSDFQTLLDIQRDQLTARDNHAQSRSERLVAAVDLYLALGGGWSGTVSK